MSETTDKTSYSIKTFGCKVNTYDSGLLQERLKDSFRDKSLPPIHILNTCAVTAEATTEALRHLRRLKRKDPSSLVVVTGCGAQVDTKQFQEEAAADLIIANSHKGDLENIIKDHIEGKSLDRVFKSDIFKKEELEAGGGLEEGHTRAFLKIQDGCNSFCTYCVIPFARGRSRSISIPDLVNKVNDLHEQSYQEVVITGIHIADYASLKNGSESLKFVNARGRRQEERFYFLEDLVEALLQNTRIPRIRLSSLEPLELKERMLDLAQDPRICPHFHMSIQSANNKVLAGMRRKYDAKAVEQSLWKISERLPGAFVGMDVIAGFPGEGDLEFEDTFQRLDSLPWTRAHVFPYSDRPGTKAIELDNKVHMHIKAERANRLRELSSDRYRKMALAQIGTQKDALILKKYEGGLRALSRDYWQIEIESSAEPTGENWNQEQRVKILSLDESQESRMDGVLRGSLME